MDELIKQQLEDTHMARIQNEMLFGKGGQMREHEILIDEIEMDDVQMLITAVNESKLNEAEKTKIRKHLDKWKRALTLANKIRVTF